MIRFTFCVISLALITRAVHSIEEQNNSCDHVKCPPTPKHYVEFNCAPMMMKSNDTKSCCPTHFDCSALQMRNSSQCHFGNRAYEPTEKLKNEDIESSCTVECSCSAARGGESARFRCAHIDCPEFFNSHHGEESEGPNKPGKKCVRQYKANSCCSSGSKCGEELLKLATCDFGGKTYYDGERIDTDGACYSCLCGPGWEKNATFAENPHCTKINCNMELHYQEKIEDGCIPVYLDDDQCCPIMWRCPDDETTVVPSSKKLDDSPHKCSFGNLTMNVGDVLSPENEYDTCTICECKIPPMAHCIQTC